MMLAPGRDRTRRGDNNSAKGQQNGASSRYEVQERVGQSTLWIAYRARERANGQFVLLKALKAVFNKHPRFTESIFETGEKLLQLSHPNVATLYELGREEGTLYTASEWLSGGSLETRLHKAPLSTNEIVPVVREIISGLGYLHSQGLIHGDLRPRQILCSENGEWKITDIGLASAFGAAGMATADAQPEAAFYLAPERTLGAPPSPASDIYAVGIILYRMLTGRVPFDGPSPLSIALRHRTDAPLNPTQLNTRADAALSELTLRLLSKNPEDRPDMAALGRELKVAPAPTRPMAVAAVPVPVAQSTPDPALAPHSDGPTRKKASPVIPDTPPPPVDMKTLRRRHIWREFRGMCLAFLTLVLLLSGVAASCLAAYRYWVDDIPPEVKVPTYLGMNIDNATVALENQGLTLRVGREVFDPKKEAGTVIGGDPPPGKIVRAPREIVVTVSQGEQPISMYDFNGLTLTEARKIILLHGMRLGQVIEEFNSSQPKDYICGQYPESGQPFRRKQPITLTVSRGPQPKDIDSETDPTVGQEAPTAEPTEQQFSTDEIDPSAAPTSKPKPDGPLVTKAARIRVAVPADGDSKNVKIIVRDDTGERTVYEKQRRPGEVVSRTIRVKRAEGSKAEIQVFMGDELVKDLTL